MEQRHRAGSMDSGPAGHAEKWLSAGGGFIGIFFVYALSDQFIGAQSAGWMVASMGASAVLLFAVPHGPLSRPWALVGGHLVSALAGVTVARLIGDPATAAALAVASAIGLMYYLRCIHPPGGATALTAVVGGSGVEALGYQYVFTPVLLNLGVLLVIAIAVNYPFAWRRYPIWLGRKAGGPATDGVEGGRLSHADLRFALGQLNSYVDVTEEDLERIFELAYAHHRGPGLEPGELAPGRCYSNGEFGDRWEVRQIRAVEGTRVDYQVVAGPGRRRGGHSSRKAFSRWGSYEVTRRENTWHRVGGDGPVPDEPAAAPVRARARA